MRMNFKQSGEIYTNELNKRQNYAGKTNRILIMFGRNRKQSLDITL